MIAGNAKNLILLTGLALVGITGCEKATEDLPETVLAQVGNEVISVEDYQQAMKRRPVGDDQEARIALLEELIENRAMIQTALERGYDRDPEIIAAYDRLLVNKVRAEDGMSAGDLEPLSKEAIEAYYETHRAEFTVPAKIRVSMIFVAAPEHYSESKRSELLSLLETIRREADQAPDRFDALAAEHSDDQATRYRGGDVGYLVEGMSVGALDPATLDAAFLLSTPGELSQIVETSAGYHLLRLTERREAAPRPLESVMDQIRSRLAKQARVEQAKAFSTRLREGRKIVIHPERLERIDSADAPPVPEPGTATPPQLPTGR